MKDLTMYRYERLLVGLTGADRDKTTVQYAAMISRLASSESAVFAHVAKSHDVPEQIRRKYAELLEPDVSDLRERMSRLTAEYSSFDPEAEVSFEVKEGVPLVEMLRIAQHNETDLVLVGKTTEHHGSGMLPEKLARKAPCSVLVVPEHSQASIRKVLVALDFSEYSGGTLEVATAFASAASAPEIVCLHVYDEAARYLRSGEMYRELTEIIQQEAQRQYGKLLTTCDLKGCSPRPVFWTGGRPWEAIAEAAETERADLIVVGARGRTAPAAFVLGSVTERLIASTTIPLLAVKRKGTGLRLLDVLLNLR